MSAKRMERSNVVVALALLIAVLLLLAEASSLISLNSTLEQRIERYESVRHVFLEHEKRSQLGGAVILSDAEVIANERIMQEKRNEYDKAFSGNSDFKPARHFFDVYEQISKTPLFELLRNMPKGGALHVHDVAICSVDLLMEFTYWEHLWVCTSGNSFERFYFSRTQPANDPTCQWQLLKQLREDNNTPQDVDQRLRAQLTLYPQKHFVDGYNVWRVFGKIFRLVYGLLTYEPVWTKYLQYALTEFHDDGVQYMEIRSTLPVIYDLDGSNFTIVDTVQLWENITAEFCIVHRDFIGAKIIYSPLRRVSDEGFDVYLQNALLLKKKFPEFIAGFDLVGHEDRGRPLHEFSHKLLAVNNEIDFYFHAGETNWFGSPTDENLLDAIILGTKRIGHGFTLVKHPALLELVKREKIAIEVNPISNQVLAHVSDLRNHPCAMLFADNYPVVISSDDSAYWRATPLTHDFYVAFLGIASKTADLGMLKELARNSIIYSAMVGEDQRTALEIWESQWKAWIRSVAEFQEN